LKSVNKPDILSATIPVFSGENIFRIKKGYLIGIFNAVVLSETPFTEELAGIARTEMMKTVVLKAADN
jgi:hypothetical protein